MTRGSIVPVTISRTMSLTVKKVLRAHRILTSYDKKTISRFFTEY